jgi:hypothetical protein
MLKPVQLHPCLQETERVCVVTDPEHADHSPINQGSAQAPPEVASVDEPVGVIFQQTVPAPLDPDTVVMTQELMPVPPSQVFLSE